MSAVSAPPPPPTRFLGLQLSRLNQRRLANFRRNRRGFWSFWIFWGLFVLSLPAEFIANDRPLVVRFDGSYYFPVLATYPETTFGGDFATEAEYRDPFVKELIEEKGWILWPLVSYSYDTVNYDLKQPAPSPPDAENWLGTDDQARDVVARVLYGYRISVLFGLLLTLFSAAVGIAAGAVQGYFGGWVDLLFQRFIEIWQGLPLLYLLIILASVVEPNFWWLLGLLLLFRWMGLVGVVRAEFLRARNFDFRQSGPRPRPRRPPHHVAARAAQRHGLDPDLFALCAHWIGSGADLARFPRLWPAAWLAVAGRTAQSRQAQPPGAVVGLYGFFSAGGDAVAVGLYRRGGARCVRSAQDLRRGGRRMSLLAIENLGVRFHVEGEDVEAVRSASLSIERGETVALVGESGSGKSVTALSVMQLLPYPRASHPHGSVRLDGEELLGAAAARLQELRGNRVAMVFQEPMTSLNPLHSIEKQLCETLILHRGLSRAEARNRAMELLGLVGLPDVEERLDAWPHQLSGGQRQRVMIAMALANEPDLLIADEPTTALDVTIQAQILALLKDLQARLGMAILLITHDLGVVRHMADRVYVMSGGEIVEHNAAETLFTAPQHPYTRTLLAAEPEGEPAPINEAAPEVIRTHNLKVHFPIKRGLLRRTVGHVKAVDGISLSIRAGRPLASSANPVRARPPWGRRSCGWWPAKAPSNSTTAISKAGARRRSARCAGRCRSSSRIPSLR